jgi:thiol-disulfide isomerase/thioredoxin
MAAARDAEKDFAAALEAARTAGVPAARLTEARVVRALNTADVRTLLEMIDEIEATRGEFEVGFDPTKKKQFAFVSEKEIDGLIHGLRALEAFQNDNEAEFEEHAKAAFWTWPSWAQGFRLADLIQQKRAKEVIDRHVASLTLPLDMAVRDLDGKTITLTDLLKDRKAVLFDFWASWCGPCMRLMPELQERADALPAQGLPVVAINTDDEAPLEKARRVKEEQKMNLPWLVEMEGKPLSGALFIDSIPRMVLVAPDGRVLFNGHPLDPGLGAALAKIGVKLPGPGAE